MHVFLGMQAHNLHSPKYVVVHMIRVKDPHLMQSGPAIAYVATLTAE